MRIQTLAGKSQAAQDWRKDGVLQCRVLHGRLSCLQSTNSVAHLNKWYWPHFLVVLLPCSHPPSPHAGQLEKGDPTDQGHCQKGTSSEMSYKNVTRSECFTHTHTNTHTRQDAVEVSVTVLPW